MQSPELRFSWVALRIWLTDAARFPCSLQRRSSERHARGELSTARKMSSTFAGLTKCSSKPHSTARRAVSGSLQTVKAISQVEGASARSLAASSNPSIPGISMSIKIASGRSASAIRKPSIPLVAKVAECPAKETMSATRAAASSLSSTTKTRLGLAASFIFFPYRHRTASALLLLASRLYDQS